MRLMIFIYICIVRHMVRMCSLKMSDSAILDMDRSNKICYNKTKYFKKQKGKEVMKKIMLVALALVLALMQAACTPGGAETTPAPPMRRHRHKILKRLRQQAQKRRRICMGTVITII